MRGQALDRLTVVLCGRYPVELLLVEVDRLRALAIGVVEPLAVQIGGSGDGDHRLRRHRQVEALPDAFERELEVAAERDEGSYHGRRAHLPELISDQGTVCSRRSCTVCCAKIRRDSSG